MDIIIHAKVAILSALSSASLILVLSSYLNSELNDYTYPCTAACLVFHIYLLSKVVAIPLFEVAWRAYFLGSVFSAGILMSVSCPPLFFSAGLYLTVLSLFHFGEYLATALFNPSTLKVESFILNHSLAYNIALLTSWIEHGIYLYFMPESVHVTSKLITVVGFVLCLVGDGFRKLSMYTAGKNFHHKVQFRKKTNHVLVTNGVYSLVRHPSYTGWFCWSVSSQILLGNPICLVCYAIVSWKFFNERIYDEECALIHFFGNQYIEYKRNVPSGIPFVKGVVFQTRRTSD